MVEDFVFSFPGRVLFGAGCIDIVGRETATLGRHALVVTGTTFVQRSGLLDRLRSSLDAAGVAVTFYDQVGPSSGVDVIDAGGRIAREVGADVVLGLGGGSSLDAAKAIAVVARSDRSIWDFTRHARDVQPEPIADATPIVQVPIIASTGSETSDSAVVFDGRAKIRAPISAPQLRARVAVVDPTLTFTVPPRYTAVGGINIVSQLLERYLTSDEFPVTDRMAEGLVRVVMDSLPRAMRRGEELDARSNLSWVAAMAPIVAMTGRSNARPLTAMAHPISAYFGVEHGVAVAALWPSYMRYALANRLRLPHIARFKRYALLGRQIFGVHETDDEVAAEITTYRFRDWLRSIDMPTDLRQLRIEDMEFTDLADQAILVSGQGNRLPGGLTAEDVEHVYEGALRIS